MSTFDRRSAFLLDLARRLHSAGVSAARLEGAVRATAHAIGVECEIWSAPTGLLMSLGDGQVLHATRQTRVLRLEPGSVDLSALAALDRIAEEVIAGRKTVDEASAEFTALDAAPSRGAEWRTVGAFGLSAAAVAGLLRIGWLDITVAGAVGLVIGAIAVAGARRPHLAAASEAIAGLVATLAIAAFAHFVAPLSVQTVLIAALIVLMPGLTLTTAVTELATQQLVSGTTRFAGALVALLKLTFGTVAGAQVVAALGWTPQIAPAADLPGAVEVVSVVAAAFAFAMLFHTRSRDVPLVMASAILGFVLTRLGGSALGIAEGSAFAGAVFFSSLVMAALSNVYGRVAGRPGALVRLPGIMLMVPGSVGFRGLSSLMARDYSLGLETGVAVLSALIALTAGLLFGSLFVPPRRYL